MPHTRNRHGLKVVLKKLKFSRVVAIQGARQTGKSFLIRELLATELPLLVYQTFDKSMVRRFAKRNPDTFIEQFSEAFPLAIDEAQKVPDIFDAVKLSVDQNPKPGRYILLGSTEFSRMNRIQESLTGRMSRFRLYPLNLAETLMLPLNPSHEATLVQKEPRIERHQLFQYLDRGGMPGLFAVREERERNDLIEGWLDLLFERDIHLFPRLELDSDLCREIVEKIVTLEEPTLEQVSKSLRLKSTELKKYIKVLTHLFVLHEVHPHPLGTGKMYYFVCDVGIAAHLGASFEKKLYSYLLQEQLSQRSYRGDIDHKLYYYRNSRGNIIHLIIESKTKKTVSAVKLFFDETIDLREFEILKAFRETVKKDPEYPFKTVEIIGLGPKVFNFPKEKLKIFPWESIA